MPIDSMIVLLHPSFEPTEKRTLLLKLQISSLLSLILTPVTS